MTYAPEYYEQAAEAATHFKTAWADVWREACLACASAARSGEMPGMPSSETVDRRYQLLCGAVYQAAGACNMPERFLDALSDAAAGEIEKRRRTADLLPCYGTERQAIDPQVLAAFAEIGRWAGPALTAAIHRALTSGEK